MGIDIFTIDDGWQQEYGENDVNLTSFPGGLKSIQDAIEARGMRLGLWVPLAAIGTSTADYRNHPEWAALDQQGKQKFTITAAGPKIVMCLASPFRDAAADRVIRLIEQFHLGYVKLDLTTIFNTGLLGQGTQPRELGRITQSDLRRHIARYQQNLPKASGRSSRFDLRTMGAKARN